ncbi:hypothetical protein COOONC_24783 [Cooperia oncophora]
MDNFGCEEGIKLKFSLKLQERANSAKEAVSIPYKSSIQVQCTPSVSTSQTQYTCCCVTDEASQTEICMKNKKNQECEASVRTSDACVQPTFSVTDRALQTDSIETDNDESSETPLWSDFDRVPVLEFDVSQQTSPVATQDAWSHFDLVVNSVAIQTIRDHTKEIECEAKCKAVVDLLEVAVGQADSESWIKVYLAELDEERRQRLMDIGIQTGVLARVQHIFETLDTDIPPGSEAIRQGSRLDDVESNDAVGESSTTLLPRPSSSASVPQSPVDQLSAPPQLFRNK